MDYWRGGMDWPTTAGWSCWACGSGAEYLEWGLIHAECRCSTCGVHYFMRDDNGNRVEIPIVSTNDPYIEPFKRIWADLRTHIDEVDDSTWEDYGVFSNGEYEE